MGRPPLRLALCCRAVSWPPIRGPDSIITPGSSSRSTALPPVRRPLPSRPATPTETLSQSMNTAFDIRNSTNLSSFSSLILTVGMERCVLCFCRQRLLCSLCFWTLCFFVAAHDTTTSPPAIPTMATRAHLASVPDRGGSRNKNTTSYATTVSCALLPVRSTSGRVPPPQKKTN